jgi:AAA domain
MAFSFRPAVRESVSLLIGLSGGTGSGKTYSAMRLAHGIAGDAPFAVIDTEAGRAKHYADQFRFDHGDLTPPFTPERYADAIAAADTAKYPVIVVDSTSHEWAGEGGILDWQEHELDRMAGDDWKKREACKMAAWIKPKMSHKQMVQRLLQVRAHLILCFRAEPKIEMVRGADGKMEIREKQSLVGLHGWIPIAEKNLPYELTASFLLLADRPGIPQPIKLQAQHRDLFPLDAPITEDAGARLAAWARGDAPPEIDWLAKIYGATTLQDLRAVSRELKAKKTGLPPERVATLRTAYDARRKDLEAR